MEYKVKSTDKFVRENVHDKEVGRCREVGEEFIVDAERKDLLVSKGFVKVIDEVFEPKEELEITEELEENVEDEVKEEPVKKTTKKNK